MTARSTARPEAARSGSALHYSRLSATPRSGASIVGIGLSFRAHTTYIPVVDTNSAYLSIRFETDYLAPSYNMSKTSRLYVITRAMLGSKATGKDKEGQ